MKVALILSGQPRFYQNKIAYNSLKKYILDVYDVDVFIHTWHKGNENMPYSNWSSIKGEIKYQSSRDELEKDLVEMYKPKKYLIEEPKTNKELLRGELKEIKGELKGENKELCKEVTYLSSNMPSMFYSHAVSDLLRQEYSEQHEILYDFIIRARLDTLLTSFPNLSSLKSDKPVIYVPDNCPNPEVCNDNFSITPGWCAQYVYHVYSNILEYGLKFQWSPEKMWCYHNKSHTFVKLKFGQTFVREQ